MKKLTQYLICAAILLLGFLLNLVPLGAQTATIRQPGTSTQQAPPATGSTQQPPATATGSLTIVEPTTIAFESGRYKEFNLAARGGTEPYKWEIVDEIKNGDILDVWLPSKSQAYLYSSRGEEIPGDDYTVTVKVTDSSQPPLEATRTYIAKVAPYNASPTDVEHRLNDVEASLIGRIEKAIASSADNSWMDRQYSIKASNNALLARQDTRRTDQKLRYIVIGGAVGFVILVGLVIGFGININRKLGGTVMRSIVIAILLGLGANSALAQQPTPPVTTAPAAPGAAAPAPPAAPQPAAAQVPAQGQPAAPAAPAVPTCTVRSVSVQNGYLVQGGNAADVTITMACPRNAKLGKVTGINAGTGVATTTEIVMKGNTIISKLQADATAMPGTTAFVVNTDAGDIASGNSVVRIISQESATVLDITAERFGRDPRFSHYLQEKFQQVYGREEGNKRYLDYSAQPTHAKAGELLQASWAPFARRADVLSDLQTLEERMVSRIAAAEEAGKATRSVADQTLSYAGELAKTLTTQAGYVNNLQGRMGNVETGTCIAMQHVVYDEPDRVGGRFLRRGQPNQRKTASQAVAEALGLATPCETRNGAPPNGGPEEDNR
ncbi:MAG: hypothetical protein HYV13_02285 [Candidatus Doudnabacteria bacterium]|nr:hypothetical protein [Candidatus Doudnabacteria bacterium]